MYFRISNLFYIYFNSATCCFTFCSMRCVNWSVWSKIGHCGMTRFISTKQFKSLGGNHLLFVCVISEVSSNWSTWPFICFYCWVNCLSYDPSSLCHKKKKVTYYIYLSVKSITGHFSGHISFFIYKNKTTNKGSYVNNQFLKRNYVNNSTFID